VRCNCCNKILEDVEATAKFVGSGEYAEMCRTCIKTLPPEVKVKFRSDFVDDEEDFEEEEEKDGYEEDEEE
jgi:hypothetical protein